MIPQIFRLAQESFHSILLWRRNNCYKRCAKEGMSTPGELSFDPFQDIVLSGLSNIDEIVGRSWSSSGEVSLFVDGFLSSGCAVNKLGPPLVSLLERFGEAH